MRKITEKMHDLRRWVDPEEWYAITHPIGGNIYEVLFSNLREAEEANLEIGGAIVVVSVRIGADSEGEYVSPKASVRCHHDMTYDHSRGGMLCGTCGEFTSDQL